MNAYYIKCINMDGFSHCPLYYEIECSYGSTKLYSDINGWIYVSCNNNSDTLWTDAYGLTSFPGIICISYALDITGTTSSNTFTFTKPTTSVKLLTLSGYSMEYTINSGSVTCVSTYFANSWVSETCIANYGTISGAICGICIGISSYIAGTFNGNNVYISKYRINSITHDNSCKFKALLCSYQY